MSPSLAGAHVLQTGMPATAWDVFLLAMLLIPTALYSVGATRLHRSSTASSVRTTQVACFYVGMAALIACLTSPVDLWSQSLFWVHMVQHEVLMLLAAPLLVLSRPLSMFIWAFPAGGRKHLGRWVLRPAVRSAWRTLMHPITGWSAHALALWIWHVPVLFRAALENRGLHNLQHASFVTSALLFWSGLLLSRATACKGAAVLNLFTTTIHTSVLGALITLSDRPLYGPEIRAATLMDALQDQQLGGLIMWVPGSMIYVGVGLFLFLSWVRAATSEPAS
jgi:putative membrane protein